jgi:sigma-B regulation protein RsbU (phosphoserine phosphatase)
MSDPKAPDTNTHWRLDLNEVIELMREMSVQTDPQEMVKRYGARIRTIFPSDGFVSLSRRGLSFPQYRITRSTKFKEEIDPWRDNQKLPLLEGGLLGELLYAGEARVVQDFCPLPGDPGLEYIGGMRSFAAIPHFDKGEVLNMVVQMKREPHGFDESRFSQSVWISNLVGRATGNLVLSRQLKEALDTLDHDLKVVADIQTSLLPRELPAIPGFDLATHYQTSKWAGGDYYDFFDLRDGRWGILVADVAGHGTPAAVLMAVMHAIAHQMPGPVSPPGRVLEHVNRELAARYTGGEVAFVTAFYAVYDPRGRTLTYANAGHPSPLVRDGRTGITGAISDAQSSIPLGITGEVSYLDQVHSLEPGDVLVLFTDGITEAREGAREVQRVSGAQVGVELFGDARMAEAISRARPEPREVLESILASVKEFSHDAPPTDDRTVLVGRVR